MCVYVCMCALHTNTPGAGRLQGKSEWFDGHPESNDHTQGLEALRVSV